jgi:hypothetical protein
MNSKMRGTSGENETIQTHGGNAGPQAQPISIRHADDRRPQISALEHQRLFINSSPQALQAKEFQAMASVSRNAAQLQAIADLTRSPRNDVPVQLVEATAIRRRVCSKLWPDLTKLQIITLVQWPETNEDYDDLLALGDRYKISTTELLDLLARDPLPAVSTFEAEIISKRTVPPPAEPNESKIATDASLAGATPQAGRKRAPAKTLTVEEAIRKGIGARLSDIQKDGIPETTMKELIALQQAINATKKLDRKKSIKSFDEVVDKYVVSVKADEKHDSTSKSFEADRTRLAGLTVIAGNPKLAEAVGLIQAFGDTRRLVVTGEFSGQELRDLGVAWRGVPDVGLITNFRVPGGTTTIVRKPRDGTRVVNKVLACDVDGHPVLIHFTADAAVRTAALASPIPIDLITLKPPAAPRRPRRDAGPTRGRHAHIPAKRMPRS